jgi:hypothetical protein
MTKAKSKTTERAVLVTTEHRGVLIDGAVSRGLLVT